MYYIQMILRCSALILSTPCTRLVRMERKCILNSCEESALEKLLDFSVECEENLLPYVNTENICCIDIISSTLDVIKEYGIIPEAY